MSGFRPLTVPTRSTSCWSRRRPGSPTWCPSATAGCWSRPSPTTGGPPSRWPPTWADPDLGTVGPAVRGRPPLELRGVRLPRAPPLLRRQRLRRDGARALGMGRQAPGRQPGGGRPRERSVDQGTGAGGPQGHPHLPRDHAHAGQGLGARRLVRPPRHGRAAAPLPVRPRPRPHPRRVAAVDKARAHDSLQAFEKLCHSVDGGAALRQRTAARGPDRPAPRRRRRPHRRGRRPHPALVPAHVAAGPPPPAPTAPVGGHRPQGGGRGQRRHPRGSPSSWTGTTTCRFCCR